MEEVKENVFRSKKGSILANSIGFILLAAMAITNVTLARHARSLQTVINTLKDEHRLHPGDMATNETLQSLDSSPWALNYTKGGLPSILYVFTPKCTWCQKNSQNADSLARQVEGRYRFIGVSLSSDELEVNDYIRSHRITYPVYLASEGFKEHYKVNMTPTTILVDRDGRVLKYWLGAYIGEAQRRDIEDLFKVHLASISQDTLKRDPVIASE